MTPQTPTQSDSPPPPGRVLRVKTGYNPNSSSVGTDVPTFLALATAAGALATVALNLLATTATRLRRQKPDAPNAPADSPRDAPPSP